MGAATPIARRSAATARMAVKELPPDEVKEAAGSTVGRRRAEAMRRRTADGRVSGEAHRVAASRTRRSSTPSAPAPPPAAPPPSAPPSTLLVSLVKLSTAPAHRAGHSAAAGCSTMAARIELSPARRSGGEGVQAALPSPAGSAPCPCTGKAYTSMASSRPSLAHVSTAWYPGSDRANSARISAGSTPPPSPTPSCAAGAGASATPVLSSTSAASRAFGTPRQATVARGWAALSAASAEAISRAPEDSVPGGAVAIARGGAASPMCKRTL
mmetsp:Transcript_27855/g.90026  ORF Transcript_27855/g.90026 Transcript_27855/m.90026 type:complete len:270 (-) Transcript_27855:2690-3499(-)